MSKTDVIERVVTINSPIDRVWEALTVAEHIARWFGDLAEVDLKPGGAIKFGWSDYDSISHGVVETVDYPTTFSYRWDAGKDDDGTMWTTKVTFTLEEGDGTTTVKLVESGFAALPDELHSQCLEGNTSGWKAELADLQQHLEGASAP